MNTTTFPWWMNPNWWEAVGTISATVVALLIALSGRIKVIFESKPDLKVEEIEYTRFREWGLGGSLEFKVKNHGKLMATETYCNWLIIKKDTGERILDSRTRITDLGIVGPGCTIIEQFNIIAFDISSPCEIWVSIKCTERAHKPTKLPLKTKISDQGARETV